MVHDPKRTVGGNRLHVQTTNPGTCPRSIGLLVGAVLPLLPVLAHALKKREEVPAHSSKVVFHPGRHLRVGLAGDNPSLFQGLQSFRECLGADATQGALVRHEAVSTGEKPQKDKGASTYSQET